MTRIVRGIWLLAGTTLLATMAAAQSRQMVVEVLDGNTGKPLVAQHLSVYGGDSPDAALHRKMHFQLVTNHLGLVTFTPPAAVKWIQVLADWKTLCQSDPTRNTFSVDAIVSAGLAAPNTCGTLIQKADPGQLILFARPSTAKEELKR